jgi:5-methyltetrahydrofolate--homocysteine methyltransferase
VPELIREKYRGIRPGARLPGLPGSHGEAHALPVARRDRRHRHRLTESCAMSPASSVSGCISTTPTRNTFAVGKLARDQVEDYADRKSRSVTEMEKWLGPYLDYDPAA